MSTGSRREPRLAELEREQQNLRDIEQELLRLGTFPGVMQGIAARVPARRHYSFTGGSPTQLPFRLLG